MQAHERWVGRFLALSEKLQTLQADERLRKFALYASVIAFLTGLLVSLRYLPEDLALDRPRFLVYIAVVGVPSRLVLNTLETRLSAILVGTDFSWSRSVRIGLVSSAANMLPLPGGPLVRVAALKKAGATLSRGGAVTALLATTWVGLAFSCAGGSVAGDHAPVAMVFLAIGLFAIFSSCLGLKRICNSLQIILLVLIVKSAMVAVMLLRLHWAFAALGVDATLSDIAVFAVSGVAGSLVSVVPAGLGVNEVVAAALAPLTHISPAAAYLAVTLNRAVAIPVLLAATSVAALIRNDPQRDPT